MMIMKMHMTNKKNICFKRGIPVVFRDTWKKDPSAPRTPLYHYYVRRFAHNPNHRSPGFWWNYYDTDAVAQVESSLYIESFQSIGKIKNDILFVNRRRGMHVDLSEDNSRRVCVIHPPRAIGNVSAHHGFHRTRCSKLMLTRCRK